MSKAMPEEFKAHENFIDWDTWSLKKGAPAELVKAWDEFNAEDEEPEEDPSEKIDKSKMTPAEKLWLENIEKKYDIES